MNITPFYWKSEINELVETLDKINKLIEELNDNDDNISRKEIKEDNLEETLDKECYRYNKFTKSNPAEYIKYNKTTKNYILINNKKEITSKKLDKLIKIKKENFIHDFPKKIVKIVLQKKLVK